MNPFKKNGELLPIASINSVYVDDQTAYNLFRPTLIMEEIIAKKDALGLSDIPQDASLLSLFNQLLNHELDSIKTTARTIAKEYGNRLAKVLSTLFKPSLESISNRKNWSEEHWKFWSQISHLYLVGGLTSPILISIFYDCIQQEFTTQNIDHVQVSFIEGSQNLGTQGLATLVYDGDYLLFDFGQTSIKRRRHVKEQNQIVLDTILDPFASDYLFYKSATKKELMLTAHQLDDYILDVILATISEVDYRGNTIWMSIANYVSSGKIYSARGGYGKLAYIADNYETHLTNRLSEVLQKKMSVKLFHDTSAMGLVFKDQAKTAVISLGTAFGVAFPE